MSTAHSLVPVVPAADMPLAGSATARLMICKRCGHRLLDQEVAPITPNMRQDHLHQWGYDVLDCDDCLRVKAQGLWDRRLAPGGST